MIINLTLYTHGCIHALPGLHTHTHFAHAHHICSTNNTYILFFDLFLFISYHTYFSLSTIYIDDFRIPLNPPVTIATVPGKYFSGMKHLFISYLYMATRCIKIYFFSFALILFIILFFNF